MAQAVAVAPGYSTIVPVLGGSVVTQVINRAAVTAVIGRATLQGVALNDAHILTTPQGPPVAVVGSAVVGTSTVG
jgi:hypothetical protein